MPRRGSAVNVGRLRHPLAQALLDAVGKHALAAAREEDVDGALVLHKGAEQPLGQFLGVVQRAVRPKVGHTGKDVADDFGLQPAGKGVDVLIVDA